MGSTDILKARVPADLRRRVAAVAERELLTESAWLKRLVLYELQATESAAGAVAQSGSAIAKRHRADRRAERCDRPVMVRLRAEDRLLLDARSAARGMRPATYVSVLTRAHLRSLAPLPKEEFLALRRAIGELAAVGRNLNQIAKVAHESGRMPASVREEFRAMLKICEALRDSTKELLKSNLESWSSGHAETYL